MFFLRKYLILSSIVVFAISGFSQISVIDTIYFAPKAGNGRGPSSICINPNTNRIYVGNRYSENVSVIDGSVDSVVAIIGVEDEPLGVGVNPETNKIYVTNWQNDNVSVIDGSGDSIIATIGVGYTPWSVGVNPQTNRIYVSNINGDDVSVIDGSTNTVIAKIGVGGIPYDVAVNTETNRIYVASFGSDNFSVIDGSSDSVIATIQVGYFPRGVCVNSETNRIYVSCSPDGTVWVLQDEGSGVEEILNNQQNLNLNISPNPFGKAVEFVLGVPAGNRGENIEFLIYNVSGRLVKTFPINSSSSPVTLTWDGKTNSGEDLSSGLYFGVLKCRNEEIQKKMIMIR